MKVFILFVIFYLLFIPTLSFSQTRIKIVDQSSNSVLPLATIINLTNPAIRFADENGSLLFEWDDDDSIIVTHIGYDDKITQLSKITNHTVHLVPKPALLPNVTIQPCAKKISLHYNNFNPPANYQTFGGMSWNDNIDGAKAAIMIRPPVEGAQLSQLEFELKKAFSAPKEKEFPTSPIRFSFYSINEKTGLPSERLTNQTVFYTPKKIGKQIVALDSLVLFIPDSGLYIGIEYLVDSKYYYPLQFRGSTDTDSVIMQYPLMFEGVRSQDFRLVFYDYRKSEWYFANRREEKELDKPTSTIKFSIGYTYCDECKSKN